MDMAAISDPLQPTRIPNPNLFSGTQKILRMQKFFVSNSNNSSNSDPKNLKNVQVNNSQHSN